MVKVYGRLATWDVEGYLIQEVPRGVEVLVTSCEFEEIVGTKICLLNGSITKKEVVNEVAVTKEKD